MKNRMSIAYLSTFHPHRGGIAQFNAALYRALQARNDVEAFNFSRQYPGALFPGTSQYVNAGDRADPVGNRRTLDSINPLSWSRTAREIRTMGPDLLLMSYWMPFFAPSMGSVARRLKSSTTVVSILHNVVPHEPKFFDRPLIRYFLRQNHGLVVMNSASEADLLSIAGPAVRYLKVPHPVYVHFGDSMDKSAARERLGIPADKRVVLFFGLIRPYKGVDLLIRAMDRLDERYALVIAGEAYGGSGAYRSLIAQSRLAGNILFHDAYIPDDRVAEYFSAADVCVLPYKSATQSGITSVAYHFDLPVIATDVGGLGEDVGGRDTGVVVGSPDPEALAAGIRKFFDEGMRAECVRNIARVKDEESWSRFAEKLTAFADTLRERPGRTAGWVKGKE
jgi:glycosyltransferase involved in cell wall biosynthesis